MVVGRTYYITKKNGWYVAFYLFGFAGCMCAWGWPKPLGIPYLVLLPLFGLFLHRLAETGDEGDRDVVPTSPRTNMTGAAILVAVIFLAISHGIYAIQISDWNYFWLPFLLVALLMFTLVRFFFPVIQAKKFLLVIALALSGVYSYGATLDLNAFLDNGAPTACPTQIDTYDITWSQSKGTNYSVVFLPCGPIRKGERFRVDEIFFHSHPTYSSYTVICHKGLFRIPWVAFTGDFAN